MTVKQTNTLTTMIKMAMKIKDKGKANIEAMKFTLFGET